MNAKEILAVIFVFIVLPAATFFGLRRAKMIPKIILTLLVMLLGAAAIPNFIRPRAHLSQSACVNNLVWIQEAKHRWAEVNHKGPKDVPTMAELFSGKADLEFRKGKDYSPGVFKNEPTCPSGGTYIVGAVNEEPKCSIGPPQHTLHPQSVVVIGQ